MSMKYRVTLWKLDEFNCCDWSAEFYCMTQWELIELFDLVTRGIKGHYKAWAEDLDSDTVIRESEVSYSRV